MKTINIRCGSDIRDSLAEAGYEGEFLEWGDPVCRGPVPENLDGDAYRAVRAQYIAQWDILSEADAHARLTREAQALETLDEFDGILLWFEHDLYDQSVLIDLLHRLSGRTGVLEKMRLMSVDRFDGEERFIGFGQLSPQQLASLCGKDIPVSAAMAALGARAWDAFRRPDPSALFALTEEDLSALPYLKRALLRHLHEFPNTRHGLSMTEALMLQAVADGAKTGVEVFRKMYRETEPMPFLGDVMFFRDMEHLIDAPEPALTAAADWREPFELTGFGKALLQGEEDWVRTNGINEWRGGVHLLGEGPVWRWSDQDSRPVKA